MNNAVMVLIGVAITFVIALIADAVRRETDRLNEDGTESVLTTALEMIQGFILDLMFKAEKEFGAGTGQFKKAFVIDTVLNGTFFTSLPEKVRNLVTYEALSKLVDTVCEKIFKPQQQSNEKLTKLLDETADKIIKI
ncbi:hypothetical protein AGMMS49573_10830 [Endomicrobiia bacterium]|nr:hypothetical protein AGMMS49573_10830 [Endomicrobiia bacterium]